MATVRSICTAALQEIGATGQGETPGAADLQVAFGRFQNQIDSWAADRLTLSFQAAITITWPANTSTQTIGPTGADITAQRPVWINQINYDVPASSPTVEVPMGPMDPDQYAALSIKGLQSGYPQLFFYQTSTDSILGTLFIWPQPSGSITLQLYAPKAVAIPTSVNDIMLGPPGYQDAFMYQLALRLLTPFARNVSDLPLLPQMATDAYKRMKRPNVQPPLLGVDQALAPSMGAGYNILSDSASAPGNR